MSQPIDIVLPYSVSTHWLADLQLLYRPVCGLQAAGIYEYLMILGDIKRPVEMEDLLELSGCTMPMFDASLRKLEECDLLTTCLDEADEICTLVITAPKDQESFLDDPLLSRQYFEAEGKEGIERLKRLRPVTVPQGRRRTVNRHLAQVALENSWTEEKEGALRDAQPDWHDVDAYPFDWKVFFQGMHNTIPKRLRSRENMTRIAHLATTYGVDEVSMRIIVVRHVRDRKTWIDFDGIINTLNHTNKIKSEKPEDYQQAPLSFLKSHQPENAKILVKERQFLVSLSEEQQLPNEVINTLIEYCMERNSGTFQVPYVRALANNMARAKISTRQAALELLDLANKSPKNYKKKNNQPQQPDWYDEIPTEKSTPEEVEAVRQQLKELFGGGQDGKA